MSGIKQKIKFLKQLLEIKILAKFKKSLQNEKQMFVKKTFHCSILCHYFICTLGTKLQHDQTFKEKKNQKM